MRLRLVMPVLVGLILAACSGPVPAPVASTTPRISPAAPPATESAATVEPTAGASASPSVAPSTAASPVPKAAEPTRAPAMTREPVSTPPNTPTPRPPVEAASPAPAAARRAWAIAPDGIFYFLDSRGLVSGYTPGLEQQISLSPQLFGGQDPGRAFVLAGEDLIVVSSTSITRTLVLERAGYVSRGEIAQGGRVALDGMRRLFVQTDEAVWAYDLANLAAPPAAVTKWPADPFTPRPRDLVVDPYGKQLIVTLHDVSASPPHQQEWFQAYDLDSLQPSVVFTAYGGALTHPIPTAGGVVAGMSAMSGVLGSKLIVFDRAGKELRAAARFEGRPVSGAAGEWIYVLRDRGTWVLNAADFSLAAFAPYVGDPPLDLLLSPDGSKLYSIGDGDVGIQETAVLRAAGIAPRRGPLLWFLNTDQPEAMRPRFFPAPGAADTAFVQVGGYGETWRSDDHGRTWAMLPGLVYPNFHYSTHLSISPDFALDRTLVAFTFGEMPQYLRSTDRGNTWTPYDPPVAFVSERDGNRDIYSADRGKLGSGEARNIVRRTNSPAAEENPAWSPGWTRIAFQSNRNGNWDIYTIRAGCDPGADASGCDERRLTGDPADDMLPAWSPDGRWIAFVSMRSGQAEIWVVPSAGGPAGRLTTSGTGAWRPAWLPDSQRLLYTATQPNGSNDIEEGRLVGGSDGRPFMPEAFPLVNSPADERDATVAREYIVYLSNEGGIARTFRRYMYDKSSSFPNTAGTEPEGHPAVLDDGDATVLVTLERNGQTGIYRATSNGYEPYVVGPQFNGQPAAGPVPWQPAADWSKQAAYDWQK